MLAAHRLSIIVGKNKLISAPFLFFEGGSRSRPAAPPGNKTFTSTLAPSRSYAQVLDVAQ